MNTRNRLANILSSFSGDIDSTLNRFKESNVKVYNILSPYEDVLRHNSSRMLESSSIILEAEDMIIVGKQLAFILDLQPIFKSIFSDINVDVPEKDTIDKFSKQITNWFNVLDTNLKQLRKFYVVVRDLDLKTLFKSNSFMSSETNYRIFSKDFSHVLAVISSMQDLCCPAIDTLTESVLETFRQGNGTKEDLVNFCEVLKLNSYPNDAYVKSIANLLDSVIEKYN